MHNETGNGSSLNFVGNKINKYAACVFIIFGSLEVLSGVAGNSLLVAALLKQASLRLRNVHNLFLANLALADLFILGYWMPFFVFDLLLGYHPVANGSHCVVNGYLMAVLNMVSLLSLMGISLNRYLHVCHPRLFTRFVTLQRTVICCVSFWIVGLLLSAPPLTGMGHFDYNPATHVCSVIRGSPTSYANVVILLFSLCPVYVTGFWNVAIFRHWKNTRMKWSQYPFTSCLQEVNQTHNNGQEGSVANVNSATIVRLTPPASEHCTQAATTEVNHSEDQRIQKQGQPELLAPIVCNISTAKMTSSQTEDTESLRSCKRKGGNTCLQKLQQLERKKRKRETESIRTLLVIVAIMICAFIPFVIIEILKSNYYTSEEVAIAGNLIVFVNNSVNWIVYGAMNRSFRREYVKCLCRIWNMCAKYGSTPVKEDKDNTISSISKDSSDTPEARNMTPSKENTPWSVGGCPS